MNGRVVWIVDGDTIHVRVGRRPENVSIRSTPNDTAGGASRRSERAKNRLEHLVRKRAGSGADQHRDGPDHGAHQYHAPVIPPHQLLEVTPLEFHQMLVRAETRDVTSPLWAIPVAIEHTTKCGADDAREGIHFLDLGCQIGRAAMARDALSNPASKPRGHEGRDPIGMRAVFPINLEVLHGLLTARWIGCYGELRQESA